MFVHRAAGRMEIRENIAGWLFLTPNLIGYIMFRLLPIVFSLILSFSKWNLISGLRGIQFTGLENYRNLIGDPTFHAAVKNTLIYVAAVVPSALILALILAVILNNLIFCKSAVRLFFFIPYIASVVSISIVWNILYLPSNGPINMFLRSIGITNPPGWLSSPQWALASIIFMSVWQVMGYYSIILLAGLQGIPGVLYEAADIDGAGGLTKFFRITIPMLSPTVFFVTVIAVINSFQVFTQINIMTDGGPGSSTVVLVQYIYQTAFLFNRIGYANTIGWALFVLVFAFTLLQFKFSNRNSYVN
jgi:multiple sugar transport system permease protein